MSNQQLLDIISIMSFVLGLENLQENREQSKHNDVQSANEKQAQFLLEEMNKNFKILNEKLDKILNKGEE
jgi:hypothetical protein